MDRRTCLVTAGASLGALVAGCLNESGPGGGSNGDGPSNGDDGDDGTPEATDGDGETPEATGADGESPEPTGNRTGSDDQRTPTPKDTTGETPDSPTESTVDGVVVEDVAVRKAVRYESYMGSGGVLAADGEQYVVGSVRSDRDLTDAEFTFETEEGSWEPGVHGTVGSRNRSVAGRDGGSVGSGVEAGRSYLAFAVPSPLSAADPRIRLAGPEGAEWPLPAEATDRLAAPAPAFELDALEVPAAVSQGDPLSVSLSVRNVSETGGRFLAAVYWPTEQIADDDESRVVDREVSAGETLTASLAIETEYTAFEDGPVALSVDGHVSAEREVQVRDAG